jgi:hypothetical protein
MAPHITHPVVGRRSCRERAHSRSGRRPNKFYCRKVDEAVKFTASSSGIVVYHNTFIAPKLWNNMTHYRASLPEALQRGVEFVRRCAGYRQTT